ncbi:MAG: phage Gp37/Gp68 family protein [Pseudomonadota bacterium]
MAENSNIEWTDHTFNPWMGCQKVSPACDHCYAEVSTPARTMKVGWGSGVPRHRTAPSTWGMPKRWNDNHEAFMAEHGRRQRVFALSLGDWLDNEVPISWFVDMLEVIRTTPNLDWLLLTKRIGNWRKRMEAAQQYLARGHQEGVGPLRDWIAAWLNGTPPHNVWVGATIPNQPEADRDIPKLLQVPAAKRFLSMEPLLGPVKLQRFCACGCNKTLEQAVDEAMDGPSALNQFQARAAIKTTLGVDWVIVGGESGPSARPMHPDWARSLRDQCQAAGVPFLFKQWGEWAEIEGDYQLSPDEAETEGYDPKTDCVLTPDGKVFAHPNDLPADVLGRWMTKLGKKAAGRLLDGRTWDEVPE